MIPPYYLENPSYDDQTDGPYDPRYSDEEFEKARWLSSEPPETYADEDNHSVMEQYRADDEAPARGAGHDRETHD